MRTFHGMLKRITQFVLLLMVGVSMNTNAGLFGFGGDSWKEEVLLHDGQKVIVNRSQSYGGRHEIGQAGSISEQDITFIPPNTNKPFTFKSEFSEDIGGRNFDLLALHILNGSPYIVVQPVGCFSSNKWGMPNPPYVFFKHDGKVWQRIPLSEFPAEFKTINLVVSTKTYEKIITSQPIVSAKLVGELNARLTQPEYHSILREWVKPKGPGGCGEMISDGKGGWYGIDFFSEKPSRDACLKFCEQKKISAQYCPCETLFKGKK